MLSRRNFIQLMCKGAGAIVSGVLISHTSQARTEYESLTILHTNDMHSRIDPFPENSGKLSGLGGIAARAMHIAHIRREAQHVLLLDAGDIFQGTPYFNFYKGEPEIRLMSEMGYDAATIGNHEFDGGMDNLAEQISRAKFPFVISNYDFTGTVMEGKTVPYHIIHRGKIKIGILGVGIALEGLVASSMYGTTQYLDPIAKAREVSAYLKNKKQCDLVICLSHLGYEYSFAKISDCILAKETDYIDLIIGGHTHTFLEKPTIIQNRKGSPVVINQAGWGGVRLGRLDYIFSNKKGSKLLNAQSVILRKQTRG